jgi:hypothetical protein
MTGTADSLNVAVAAGIFAYEARRPADTGQPAGRGVTPGAAAEGALR